MRIRIGYLCCLALFGLYFLGNVRQGTAQEWTRFRGPNGTGETDCKTIPAKWTEQNILWKVKTPGEGHSSPVIWGDKLFIMSAEPQDATRYCLCFSIKDGSLLWKKDFKSTTYVLHQRSSYGSSTPAVDAERVYYTWATPDETMLIAFDHSGHEVWRKNLGTFISQHGYGASPMVYKNLVILHNSQDDEVSASAPKPGKSYMMAFDSKTGNELWRTLTRAKMASYSVPFIRDLPGNGVELVSTNNGNGVFALDVETGKMNWSVECLPMRSVNSPVMVGGLIFGSCGNGQYAENLVAAVRPGAKPELVYTLKNSNQIKAPYVPCLIGRGNLVFLFYDQGFAACVDAPTGKIHWFQRTNAAFNSSPVRLDDKLFCLDEEGVMWVFAAEDKYQVLGQNPLGEGSRATPAVVNGKMYLRTFSHLFCVGPKDEQTGG